MSAPVLPVYHHCLICDLRFLDSRHHLAADEERGRYAQHENDPNEPRFREFLNPLLQATLQVVQPMSQTLDFGAGPFAPMFHLMRENAIKCERYDPFFWSNKDALGRQYDAVVASEVVEHFYSPSHDWVKMKTLVKPGGALVVMTLIYHKEINFADWHYRRDPTHVSFYSESCMKWIASMLNFSSMEILGPRVVRFIA